MKQAISEYDKSHTSKAFIQKKQKYDEKSISNILNVPIKGSDCDEINDDICPINIAKEIALPNPVGKTHLQFLAESIVQRPEKYETILSTMFHFYVPFIGTRLDPKVGKMFSESRFPNYGVSSDSDILRINDYINDEYKITHKPVENYKLLLYSLELTNGNIDDALSLVNRYYKIKVRAPGDFGDLKTNIDEFKLKVLDEFSQDIPWHSLGEDHPPFTYQGVVQFGEVRYVYARKGSDFDLSLFNRVGEAYHTTNIILLSRNFSPELVSVMVVSTDVLEGEIIGLGKIITETSALVDLYEIDSYLGQFDPDSPRPWPPRCEEKQ